MASVGGAAEGTGVSRAGRRRRAPARRRTPPRARWRRWVTTGIEIAALTGAALVGVVAALGRLGEWFAGATTWGHVVPFAAAVLSLSVATAAIVAGWVWCRQLLVRLHPALPVAPALAVAAAAVWSATQPAFYRDVSSVRSLVGGPAEAERVALAHQVYAAYRRANLADLQKILARARVFEPTVHEAAAAFGVDPEVLMGIGAAESAFYPRDSRDGGRGLFQITAPPRVAVEVAQKQLAVAALDPLNQRHNAYVAAATLRHYLAEMGGDLFLALLAYNIGPQNGGLRSIMQQYGARDFVTIQPYLQHLPRDYPIRVLCAALAYRLSRAQGRLPPYEVADNALGIQRVGIPGLDPEVSLRAPRR
jgi:soluble lytic murein transglycosylase-like protein